MRYIWKKALKNRCSFRGSALNPRWNPACAPDTVFITPFCWYFTGTTL